MVYSCLSPICTHFELFSENRKCTCASVPVSVSVHHVLLATDLEHGRKVWHVETSPVSLAQKLFGHVPRFDESRHLFEHVEQPVFGHSTARPEQRIVDHQPLVVVRPAVVSPEQFGPSRAVGRQSVRHHRPNENEQLNTREKLI